MNKAAFGIMALLALAAFCLVPAGLDAAADIEHDGPDYFKVSTSESFDIKYTLDDADEGKEITYSAKVINKAGDTQSSAVSPSSGSLENDVAKTLTVTAPSTAGKYTLVVEFYLQGEDDADPLKKTESKYEFTAVNPIKLTVNLKAEDVTLNLEEFGVYFYIDGEKMEDSYTTVSLASDGTGSVSYDWIANPEPNSTHHFQVKAVGGSGLIAGLDETHVFYANDNDYSFITALAFITLIVLILAAVWVYRKPIKNFGKPKSRR